MFVSSTRPVILNAAGSQRQPTASPGRLPAASVSTAIYVEYLPAHLRCPCNVENCVHNVCYVRYFSHWLQRLKKVLGFTLVHWCVHDARGYGVEADTFFCVLDC